MTRANGLAPVLLLGGSGVVGARAARTLRWLQPELPLWIAGRDLPKAEAVAHEVGGSALRADLDREDLGLRGSASVSAVVALLKDDTLNALRFARARGVPFVAFSNWSFDIAPEVALWMQRPAATPLLLLGHLLGGTVIAITLHAARELRGVRSIQYGMVMDSDDGGGPATHGDFDRITHNVPNPLLRRDGKWAWVSGAEARRSFVDAMGVEQVGTSLPLLDIPSLAAATGAASVRADLAIRDAASRAPGSGPSHSVSIELEGDDLAGRPTRLVYDLRADAGHSMTSAYGAALAIERLLGLAGGEPAGPGLHLPETLFEPAAVVARLRELGVRIERR